MTQKIAFVNTYDPYPQQSEVFLFDVVNKSWSNTGRPCPLASELSACVTVPAPAGGGRAGGDSGGVGGGAGGDSLVVIGGWTNTVGTKSLNQRGAVNVMHEFKVRV